MEDHSDILVDPVDRSDAAFEAEKRARYERLSLLTLDIAEIAGKSICDIKDKTPGTEQCRHLEKAMASLSRAIWAHQIVERLRQGKPLSRRELMRLALGAHSFYRLEKTNKKQHVKDCRGEQSSVPTDTSPKPVSPPRSIDKDDHDERKDGAQDEFLDLRNEDKPESSTREFTSKKIYQSKLFSSYVASPPYRHKMPGKNDLPYNLNATTEFAGKKFYASGDFVPP